MKRTDKKRPVTDRSPSPIERYYNGEITADEYARLISNSTMGAQVLRASEKRVNRILRARAAN